MSVREAFADQAKSCAALGSPFTAQLLTVIGARLEPGTPVADRVLNWEGDPTSRADSVPLRLAGALHALKLEGLALTDVYPPGGADDEALWRGIQDALEAHSDRLLAWMGNAPQTNEVRRAAAILPCLTVLQDAFGLPVELLELGTSAGLNLRADQFRLNLPSGGIGPQVSPVQITPDWVGPLPPTDLPSIVRRAGVDLSPIDPFTSGGELRLLAYLWADQTDRLARTRAATELARSTPAEIFAGDAGDWLEGQLSEAAPERLRVVFHTVAWQYFPEHSQEKAERAMANAIGPLARISMEYDGGEGALVSLTTWPSGQTRDVARVDFHGRWVHWFG